MGEMAAIGNLTRSRSHASNNSELKNERVVASVISVCLALLFGSLTWAFIFFRRRRRRARDRDSEQPSQYRNDYNAEPLFPHRPLQTLSDSSFSVEAGPGPNNNGSSHPRSSAPQLPVLPDLGGGSLKFETLQQPTSTTPSTSINSSSDEDDTISLTLDPAFSDPFSDSAAISRSKSDATPSVSPSTYPLRDRLNRDTIRRRRAIENIVRRNESQRGRYWMIIGEQEMQDWLIVFDMLVEEQRGRERLGRSRSLEDVRKGEVKGRLVSRRSSN